MWLGGSGKWEGDDDVGGGWARLGERREVVVTDEAGGWTPAVYCHHH